MVTVQKISYWVNSDGILIKYEKYEGTKPLSKTRVEYNNKNNNKLFYQCDNI